MRHLLRRAKPADGMNGDQRLFGARRIGAASSGEFRRDRLGLDQIAVRHDDAPARGRKRAGDGGADA